MTIGKTMCVTRDIPRQKTARQKMDAEDLAKKVPNVQQVVDEIEVNPKKHSTTVS
jgi:hypothetical protein